MRKEERVIDQTRIIRGLLAGNLQNIVSHLLPTSIYLTYIFFGNKICLATFITAGILIKKVRSPTDKLLQVSSKLKALEMAMGRMHKVLKLDEVQ